MRGTIKAFTTRELEEALAARWAATAVAEQSRRYYLAKRRRYFTVQRASGAVERAYPNQLTEVQR